MQSQKLQCLHKAFLNAVTVKLLGIERMRIMKEMKDGIVAMRILSQHDGIAPTAHSAFDLNTSEKKRKAIFLDWRIDAIPITVAYDEI